MAEIVGGAQGTNAVANMGNATLAPGTVAPSSSSDTSGASDSSGSDASGFDTALQSIEQTGQAISGMYDKLGLSNSTMKEKDLASNFNTTMLQAEQQNQQQQDQAAQAAGLASTQPSPTAGATTTGTTPGTAAPAPASSGGVGNIAQNLFKTGLSTATKGLVGG